MIIRKISENYILQCSLVLTKVGRQQCQVRMEIEEVFCKEMRDPTSNCLSAEMVQIRIILLYVY